MQVAVRVVRVQLPMVLPTWARLIRRILGLGPGRYALIVDIDAEGPCGWQVLDLSKWEN